MSFRDRSDAGQQLADELIGRIEPSAVVLALPRGGVPVAAEVARALDLPLDVIIVRKLGVPSHPEYAMGAIGELGVRILDGEVIRGVGISDEQLAVVDAAERAELERRARRYRGQRGPLPLMGRTAVIVDDGMATGSTALAASQVARMLGAARVVMAVPVASAAAVAELRWHVDQVVCLLTPEPFHAVGRWYERFDQTSDEEVVDLLSRYGVAGGPSTGGVHGAAGGGAAVGDDWYAPASEVSDHVRSVP